MHAKLGILHEHLYFVRKIPYNLKVEKNWSLCVNWRNKKKKKWAEEEEEEEEKKKLGHWV